MTDIALTVNGVAHRAAVAPRTHLADFLREHLLLTGTHLGCEQGVCGACTVLLNGEPVRACITFAALCDGADVRSIEGLDDDPVTTSLRAAFAAEHALQCGYCTPGMLVTARDIIRRLPAADDDRVRLELAGNLCRCTGYNGIVRAIRRVLDAPPEPAAPPPSALPEGVFGGVFDGVFGAPSRVAPAPLTGGTTMTQTVRLSLPVDTVWAAVQDPALIARCLPGARLTATEGGRLQGEMVASLGPIAARFAGSATVTYDPATRAGLVAGEGRDQASATRLTASADFRVLADGDAASIIALDITYALRGPLAQFGRGPVVRAFAAELAETVARNLAARLRGEALPPSPRLHLGALLWRVLRGLIGR